MYNRFQVLKHLWEIHARICPIHSQDLLNVTSLILSAGAIVWDEISQSTGCYLDLDASLKLLIDEFCYLQIKKWILIAGCLRFIILAILVYFVLMPWMVGYRKQKFLLLKSERWMNLIRNYYHPKGWKSTMLVCYYKNTKQNKIKKIGDLTW